jgi:hypothetical protein
MDNSDILESYSLLSMSLRGEQSPSTKQIRTINTLNFIIILIKNNMSNTQQLQI